MANLTRDQIISRMNAIFQGAFDDESIEVHDAMTAKDIEDWDSLMQITLVVAIEGDFGIALAVQEVVDLQNVGQMIGIIEARATND